MSAATIILGGVDTLYRSLGEAAPTLSHDATVVWCYETGRMFGDLTLELRDITQSTPESWPEVSAILSDAVAADPSGALCVYALTMLIAPRLLVTVRDVRDELSDAERGWADRAATAIVSAMHDAGRLGLDPAVTEDPQWAMTARELRDRLDDAGYGESFRR